MKLTRDDLLVLLIEECGEVIQAATKCLRFGFEADHGVGYGRNDLVLAQEVGDLVAVIDALKLDASAMDLTFKAKIAKAEAAKERYGVHRT
jgi:NTP pyrophosphatase (non-canonical NTP hydrolase)